MRIVLVLFIVFSCSMAAFSQKVKTKKGVVYVDAVAWSKYETQEMGTKMFLTTMAGEEYASITKLSFATGKYDRNGKQIEQRYSEVNFYKTAIGIFEMRQVAFTKIIGLFFAANVLEADKFNEANALAFKQKHAEDITGRHFKTKN